MKKIDTSKSLIFSRNIEDLKNSLDYLYHDGYCSNSKDFSECEEGNLDGVHASNFMLRPFELTQNGDNQFFSYFIPKSKVVFVEEPKKLRQFKSIDEFFDVTGFNIGEVVHIQRFANSSYDEKTILNGFRVDTDEFHRIDVIFGSGSRTLNELSKYYEYLKNGKWLRFGVEE